MNRKIYISGMNSGQNPASGLGITRCIKRAFPELTVVGVDHWQGSTGLHDAEIDDVLLLPQWAQIDTQAHVDRVRGILDEGHLWISSLDMEVHWLAENLGTHPHLLAPATPALEVTSKPAVRAIEHMDFRVPEWIPADGTDTDLHAFLRHKAWNCWLKSPYHDARRITSWGTFTAARTVMSQNWKTSRLFLQKNVLGHEETIAFAAYQGQLLGAIHMQKRQITPEGKTWAGRVNALEPSMFRQLSEMTRTIGWNGGGELEFVRDPDGQKWIIECNPRFPAWIFGGALGGLNLPAKLVSRVLGLPFLETRNSYPLFTRVVQEIPAKEAVGIPSLPDPSSTVWTADGKKGKSGPSFSSFIPDLESQENAKDRPNEPVPMLMAQDLQQATEIFTDNTPARVHLPSWTRERFESLARRVRKASQAKPRIRIGYSVKTSPTDHHLALARESGFLAECISQMEVHRAIQSGYQAHQVILNGPGKFWPLHQPPVTGLHLLFCDSVEEFERVIAVPGMARGLGFRMRIPRIHSRFGNPLDDFGNFQRIVASVRKIRGKAELGFHFHMPSWAIGVNRWMEALRSLLIWCQSLEQLTGARISHLDLGGGFFPNDLEKLDFPLLQETVRESLPELESLYFEPGRALTQDTEALISRVLDVRRTAEGKVQEVVVDACIAELPLAQAFSHRVFYSPRSDGSKPECRALAHGPVRVLGRICMEDDILSPGVRLPEKVEVGDLVIFGDAGGYERSMSYGFGRG